jgi:hypothetical protein
MTVTRSKKIYESKEFSNYILNFIKKHKWDLEVLLRGVQFKFVQLTNITVQAFNLSFWSIILVIPCMQSARTERRQAFGASNKYSIGLMHIPLIPVNIIGRKWHLKTLTSVALNLGELNTT